MTQHPSHIMGYSAKYGGHICCVCGAASARRLATDCADNIVADVGTKLREEVRQIMAESPPANTPPSANNSEQAHD